MVQSTNDLITAAIAIYGATLATLSFALSLVLAVFELRRHRPRVRVTAQLGQIVDTDGKSSEPLIVIEATNLGAGAVVLTGMGWLLRDGSKRQYMKLYMLELPLKLEERRTCTTYRACRWFREDRDNNRIVAAYFQDETGQLWKGKVTRQQRKLWVNAKDEGWRIMWNSQLMTYYRSDS